MRARSTDTRTAQWCYRIAAVLVAAGMVHLGTAQAGTSPAEQHERLTATGRT